MTPVMQQLITAAALAVAASAITFAVLTWSEKRNADLVRIGISVLRVDPQKEKDISEATRKWALDLIDANAGGVKFSDEARKKLLRERLEYDGYFGDGWCFNSSPSDPTQHTSPNGQPK